MAEVQKSGQRPSKSSTDGDGADLKKLINKELDSLFKTGKPFLSRNDLIALRSKFKEDPTIADQIMENYAKQWRLIKSHAKIFAKYIADHYGNKNYPAHRILKKALKLKQKAGWNDSFFREFQRLYEIYLTGNIPTTYRPTRTVMGKVLGTLPPELVEEARLNVSDKEHEIVNKFLESYESTKAMWSHIMFQTLVYRTVPPEVVQGTFDPKKDNALSHVHPILAAMFIPKIPYFEEIFLYSNIASIVKSRHEGKPIMTRPNAELLNNIVTDPMDIVCTMASPMADLYARWKMQAKIWESVFKLRNGQFYHEKLSDFLTTVDSCRLSSFDMPDLMFVADVSAAVRRMFSAFSLRPTTILTLPVPNNMGFSPMPYEQIMTIPKIRSIPMVTLRLPPKAFSSESPIHLEDSMRQAQWFMEDGKNLVYKAKTVTNSDSILVFYVNRLNSIDHLINSNNVSRLPLTIGGIDDINDTAIKFSTSITLAKDDFDLVSVLASEKLDLTGGKSLVTGSIALIIKQGEDGDEDTYLRYDPVSAGLPTRRSDGTVERSDPISLIPQMPALSGTADAPESFTEIASQRGVIFFYSKRSNITA